MSTDCFDTDGVNDVGMYIMNKGLILNVVTIPRPSFPPFPLNVCIFYGSNLFLFQDGWVGFKAVLLKKRLTAADFYNGYLHQTAEGLFVSRNRGTEAHQMREKSTL